MNLKEIKDLIELVSDKGFADFEIERKGFRLRISRFGESQQSLIHPAPPIVISSHIPGSSEVLSSGSQRSLTSGENPPSGTNITAAQKSPEVESEASQDEVQSITSPIVGTFYVGPSPDSPPFVSVGDHVEPHTIVCIVEAMKLMNEIESGFSGVVAEVFVDNGQPVEYGQVLFAIKA